MDENTFKVLPRLKRLIFRIHPVKEYIKKGNQYLDKNKPFEALIWLDKGMKHYPNNYDLNKLKALVEMEHGSETRASLHWDLLLNKHAKRMTEQDYIKAVYNLQALNKDKEVLDVLKRSLRYYPNSIEVLHMIATCYIRAEDWEKAIQSWTKLFVSDEYTPIEADYIDLSYAYFKKDLHEKAEYVIQKGIELYKDSSKLLIAYIDLSINIKKWELAADLIDNTLENFDLELSSTQQKRFGMVYQIIGDKEKYDYFYKDVLDKEQSDHISHHKLTLFDNGETRIDFYKRSTKTNKVIITFDSLNMTWDKPSFGFKLLSEQNIDIIAVQKRQKKTYHQDLSLEDFLKTVESLVNGYSTRISYGFSLGAYMVIYYTGALDCTILSLAPRLSIHPVYGKKREIGKEPFHHHLRLRENEYVKPIIVYDPKDKIDYPFIKHEVLQAYPNAHLVKIPYGGHSMAPHLLRMGLLKEFILTVIQNNQLPVYNRKRKLRSANYHRLLGRECLRRGKVLWAKELSNRAYALLPNDHHVVNLKIDVLKRIRAYDEAEHYLHIAIKDKPKRLAYRLTLIDIYILQGNLFKAEKSLEHTDRKSVV